MTNAVSRKGMVFLAPLLDKDGLGEVLLRLHEPPSIPLVMREESGTTFVETARIVPGQGRSF